ncbi:carbonic anhydrase 1 [Leptinotarsa decemlineata]|uniref:carbonic anhydrase 1 n=1 Tax=Leptinotarsa decemlineata TaxID=7539 RepID=UPI003D30CB82
MKCEDILFCFLLIVYNGYGQEFGYDGTVGPSYWGRKFQSCAYGKLQSPIDIEENNVTVVKFPPLVLENFDSSLKSVTLLNNGHTVQLSIEKDVVPIVHGGPLKGIYRFAQLHFHWGKTDSEGSENLINNHSFPLELHMVFYSIDYGTFETAANKTDGLTVLSFLYHKSDEENPRYAKFENKLLQVKRIGSTIGITDFGSLDNFTTTLRDTYFTYKGSLTTPPCSEVVVWIEFLKTIPLSHSQIQEFRLLTNQEGRMDHNFRPIQPLYDRVVYLNSPQVSSSSKVELCVATSIFLLLLKVCTFTLTDI